MSKQLSLVVDADNIYSGDINKEYPQLRWCGINDAWVAYRTYFADVPAAFENALDSGICGIYRAEFISDNYDLIEKEAKKHQGFSGYIDDDDVENVFKDMYGFTDLMMYHEYMDYIFKEDEGNDTEPSN